MKSIRRVAVLLGLTVVAAEASAAGAFISAAQVAEQISAADAAAKAGKSTNGGSLLEYAGYRGALQYLTAPMKIYSQHEDEDELFLVLDGGGTITLGATLVNPKPGAGATTLVADSGTGGEVHKLTKGDMFILPAHSSRSVTQVDGKLVMMSMRLPHGATATPATPKT